MVYTGDENTAVGRFALATATTAQWNTAVGTGAGYGITTGNHNVAIGVNALVANTDGQNNIGLGSFAGDANTTADNMTAVGYRALTTYNRTDGANSNNTAVGAGAFLALTTGNANTAVGSEAGANQQGAANCTFLGYRAGKDSTGESNTFVGSQCGDATDDGLENTAVGQNSLTSNCGNGNSALGHASLYQCTGTLNIGIGASAGWTITDGQQKICIGSAAVTSSAGGDNQIVMGEGVTGVGNTNFTFGNGATDSNIAFGATSITAPSDVRLKEDIQDETIGLDFINALRPVTFLWKKEKDIPENLTAHKAGSEVRAMNGKHNHGFIAQEVKATIDSYDLKDGFDMWQEDERDGRQRVAPSALVPILVKAIQEQNALIEALTARITTLEG